MFDHYVMFKLRDNKKGEMQAFVDKLKQLKADVPSIRELNVFLNARQGPKSYDILYFAAFDDETGFQEYMKHPKHIPVMKYVDEVCSGIADVDVKS
jgi:hypothetical protein